MTPEQEDRHLLGAWLRITRRKRKMTASEIARRLRCDVSHVCTVERGRSSPGFSVFKRWLKLLGVDLLAAIGARD